MISDHANNIHQKEHGIPFLVREHQLEIKTMGAGALIVADTSDACDHLGTSVNIF